MRIVFLDGENLIEIVDAIIAAEERRGAIEQRAAAGRQHEAGLAAGRNRIVGEREAQGEEIQDVIEMEVRYDNRVEVAKIGMPPQFRQRARTEVEHDRNPVSLHEKPGASLAGVDAGGAAAEH